MSSCLSSRAAACGFNLKHMIKWPSCTSTTTSNSSSPSSTLSESTNSVIAISTRKPRKPRKRPNQTYNEAAALLSMACPNIFTTKHLTTSLPKQNHSLFNESPELIEIQQRITEKPFSLIESKVWEIESNCVCEELSDGCLDDLDTESILDEEIEQGIDSIMGDSSLIHENIGFDVKNSWYGYPIGLGFGVRNGVRALKNDNQRNWWCSPMVDVEKLQVAKKKKKKKKKKKTKKVDELMEPESELEHLSIGNGHRLMLKLDYEGVMNAWTGGDIHAKAANIDLFSKNGGSSRSMDKNHFNKIRSHQVKNACSDRRPRCKGRFVKKPISSVCFEET